MKQLIPERIALAVVALLALMGLFVAIKARGDLASAIASKAISNAQ